MKDIGIKTYRAIISIGLAAQSSALFYQGRLNARSSKNIWDRCVHPSYLGYGRSLSITDVRLAPYKSKSITIYQYPDTYALDATVKDAEPNTEHLDAFASACNVKGMITIDSFMKMKEISSLLEDGLLEQDEVYEMWTKVAGSTESLLDFDGFIRVSSDIEDLFEDFNEKDTNTKQITEYDDDVSVRIESAFQSLVGSVDSSVSLDQIMQWKDVDELLLNNLLAKEEVKALFNNAATYAACSNDRLDLKGFARFVNDLDDMYDEGEEEPNDSAGLEPTQYLSSIPAEEIISMEIVKDSPDIAAEFVLLAGSMGGSIAFEDVLQWETVKDIFQYDDVDVDELQVIWDSIPKVDSGRIDFDGFLAFNVALDDMFVSDEDDEIINTSASEIEPVVEPENTDAKPDIQLSKKSTITLVEAENALMTLINAESQSCGINSSSAVRNKVLRAAEDLVESASGTGINIVEQGIEACLAGLVGKWRLLFSTSRSMEFNQGLTGIARSFSGANFSGLIQNLDRDGQMLDCTYTEELGNIEVTVTGDWEVREAVSLLSGVKSIALDVTTKRVKYGFINIIGERWKPLRAMALLDIIYLDKDLRIMRGQTTTNAIFVLRREK